MSVIYNCLSSYQLAVNLNVQGLTNALSLPIVCITVKSLVD